MLRKLFVLIFSYFQIKVTLRKVTYFIDRFLINLFIRIYIIVKKSIYKNQLEAMLIEPFYDA